MTLKYTWKGDESLAAEWLAEAKRLLYGVHVRKNIGKVKVLTDGRVYDNGISIAVASIFNQDFISIVAPVVKGGIELPEFVGSRVLLYLVTIAVPVRADSDFVEFTDYDIDNLHVCKMYAYTLKEDSGVLMPDNAKILLRHNYYTVGGGLTLTMQEGYLAERPDHYATLSNMFSQEEEIGSINWRAFQAGGGYSLGNLGEPDTNTYWGAGFARFMKWALYGSALGLEHPDPTTEMMYSYAARKGYVLDEDEAIYNDLVYTREVINGQFAPYYWYDYLPGQALFVGIIEFLNPNYRWVYKHIIGALDIRTNTNKYTVIAEDEHELQNYPIQSSSDTSLNWKYHVPIMLVSDTEALMRIVKRVGTNKTCWEATLTEELVIGKSASNLKLDDISIHNTGGITATSVVGDSTIGANDSKGYTLDGCQQDDRFWTVSGTGATINSATGQLTTVAACGVITVTGTCVSCGVSASMDVLAPGSWNADGRCTRNEVNFCFPNDTWTYIYDGKHRYYCAAGICGIGAGEDCSNQTWSCTGDCTVSGCFTCSVINPSQYHITNSITCALWGC